jgi:hypothetical protein
MFIKMLHEIKKNWPQNAPKEKNIFLLKVVPFIVCFHLEVVVKGDQFSF